MSPHNQAHGSVPTQRRHSDTVRQEGANGNRFSEVSIFGRLNVEHRFLAMISAFWLSTLASAFVVLSVVFKAENIENLPWLGMIFLHTIGIITCLAGCAALFPSTRWRRGTGSSLELPSLLPLSIAGFPAIFIYPYLRWRDKQARGSSPDPEEIEIAFRRLLGVPRTAMAIFIVTCSCTHLAATWWACDSQLLSPTMRTTTLLLSIASMMPFASMIAARGRAILRSEYLCAPRANPSAFPRRSQILLRIGLPGVIVATSAVFAPILVGSLWSHDTVHGETLELAKASVDKLLILAQSNDQRAIGRFLGSHPGHHLSIHGRKFGRGLHVPPLGTGSLDSDNDSIVDIVVARTRSVVAATSVDATATGLLPFSLLATLGISGIACLLCALVVTTCDLRKDVVRTTAQVDAVTRGEIPTRLGEGSISTQELRQLVQSVDRLVGRITATNIAKYIVIEKAQEADRLKSQFLANMSHDLRSPLNSILGFSELLLTGIDGPITDEQAKMCTTIHASGQELLQQIDDILDTAKIEAGRMDLHAEPTPPATLVTRAVERARKRQSSRIRYDTHMAAGLAPAFVDSYRTTQAIENVLVFASERMPSGTIHIDIAPGRIDGERMIVIEINTPLRPASANQLSQVLGGFFRIPGHKGLGLGLPIAGSIVEIQSGSLGIEEVLHADGSLSDAMVFTIHLPAPEPRRQLRLRQR